MIADRPDADVAEETSGPRMKNRPLSVRARAALTGIRNAWGTEASFRTQCAMALLAVAGLIPFRPTYQWWAIFALVIAGTLAFELVNTALEHVVDRLHPEVHPMIRVAKDCAAGAVLLMSTVAVVVLALFLLERLA